VDLCKECNASETLDPVNIAKERNGNTSQTRCQNVPIQRGQLRGTVIGRSSIDGWGLFVREYVEVGGFLRVLFSQLYY